MTVSQTDFVNALLDPNVTPPSDLKDPDGRVAGKRFDVYRNTVISSLMAAMEVAFPVTQKLLGDTDFRNITASYVRFHPPKSPILMFYGEEFPAFINTFKHVKTKPYLADIARLELMRRQSYHAADATAISADQLAQIAPEELVHQRFILSPSLQLLPSNYPIVSIWNMKATKGTLLTSNLGETALITRPKFDVHILAIDPATHRFIIALATENLGDAYDTALGLDNKFDLTSVLKLLLNQDVIVDIIP